MEKLTSDIRAEEILEALDDEQRAVALATRGPCLLYTSPSPRDRTRSRMPSSA